MSYIGYLALRSSISDVEKARRVSSVFGVSAYITIPLSFISAVTFKSLHAQIPQQPLSQESCMLLALRVVVSFLFFLSVLRYYFKSLKN
jgi:membrane protein YdbS with pleckstrin-like domain